MCFISIFQRRASLRSSWCLATSSSCPRPAASWWSVTRCWSRALASSTSQCSRESRYQSQRYFIICGNFKDSFQVLERTEKAKESQPFCAAWFPFQERVCFSFFSLVLFSLSFSFAVRSRPLFCFPLFASNGLSRHRSPFPTRTPSASCTTSSASTWCSAAPRSCRGRRRWAITSRPWS